jgi:hypothetical protein
MNVTPLHLASAVPTVPADASAADMRSAAPDIKTQLAEWGFMAAEVPGLGQRVAALTELFRAACLATEPRLADFVYTSVPQLSNGGTHGFFPYLSEVPRLANGVPDPKEFIHVSGAMLDDRPPGAAGVLKAFPEFGAAAASVFDTAFRIITLFGEVIRSALPPGTPDLDLSRDATNLRVIYYRDLNGREVLAHEHSGIQMLGLQLPPSDQGLQYVLHDGTWVEPVIAGTDVVICNVGRMLTKASADRFRPSTHRVHCAPSDDLPYRLSAVLFAYPPHKAQQWIMKDEGLTMLDATWADFIADRFRGLGDQATQPAEAATPR